MTLKSFKRTILYTFSIFVLFEICSQIVFYRSAGTTYYESLGMSHVMGKLIEEHPYLIGTPRKSVHYEYFDRIRQKKIQITHNSFGLRGPEPVLVAAGALVNVAVVGGSTTYGLSLSDGEDWPSKFSSDLGSGFQVINFGVPGYTSVEHLIQTALYFSPLRIKYAIFFAGYNDAHTAYVQNLTADYVGFHTDRQFPTLRTLLTGDRWYSYFASSYYVAKYFSDHREYYEQVQQPATKANLNDRAVLLQNALDLYKRNLRSIIALCAAQKIKPIFVPQVMNSNENIKPTDLQYWWVAGIQNTDQVRALNEAYNHATEEVAAAAKVLYLKSILDIKFEAGDFLDSVHLSESGNQKLSREIAARVKPVLRDL